MTFNFPPNGGGGAVLASELANSFAKIGNNITVMAPAINWDTGKSFNPEMEKTVTVHRIETPYASKPKTAARLCKSNLQKKAISMVQTLELKRFDFVMSIFHPYHLVSSAAVNVAEKLNIPCIVKIDDAIFDTPKSVVKKIQRKVEKMASSRALKKADAILVSNSNTLKLISEHYGVRRDKIHVVPNGVNLLYFNKEDRTTQYTKDAIEKSIVFSGVMYHHRGLDVLLQAAPKIVTKEPQAKFILLGDGPEMQKLKDITKKNGLEKNVEFRGWVDRSHIPHELRRASVGIGPLKKTAVTENALPIKVLEYMAASLPIVAMEGTLPDDVLENNVNGYTVTDTDSLAESISYLLEHPQTVSDMGNNSYKMAQKFSWEKVAKSIIEIYNSLEKKR